MLPSPQERGGCAYSMVRQSVMESLWRHDLGAPFSDQSASFVATWVGQSTPLDEIALVDLGAILDRHGKVVDDTTQAALEQFLADLRKSDQDLEDDRRAGRFDGGFRHGTGARLGFLAG
jgi:hypothetical protein